MNKTNSDFISSDMLNSGNHYYSHGQALRDKHKLAGYEFVNWTLDLISLEAGDVVLDAGGGWGRYIWQLIDQNQLNSANAILTDLSEGMLHTAIEEAKQRNTSIQPSVCNLEDLPFSDNIFDLVMANKVIYHLKDIIKGICELARVVKPDGIVLANTNSEKITATIIDLHYQALDRLSISYTPEPSSPFTMENGGELLATAFHQVETHYFESETLIYDSTEMRATYESIGRYRNLQNREDIDKDTWQHIPIVVEKLARNIIQRDGVLRLPNLMGAFVCREPKQ